MHKLTESSHVKVDDILHVARRSGMASGLEIAHMEGNHCAQPDSDYYH